MKVWSKGLGKIELILDFEKYHVEKGLKEDGEKVYIKGLITEPVIWDFRITMTKEDIPGLLNIALNPIIMKLFIKNIKTTFRSAWKRIFRINSTHKRAFPPREDHGGEEETHADKKSKLTHI